MQCCELIASIDTSAEKTICTANTGRRVRHRHMSNEDQLVIQKILSHRNTKKDELVELLPTQSKAPLQVSLFE
jgi:hypothetical protein